MPFYARDAVNRLPDNDRNRLLRTTLPVGRSASNGDEFLVPLGDRYAGTYVIGIQGSGKSSLLENQIEHDIICGNAVVVIDPHGDLADHTLAAPPDAALPRTYILDMTDEEYPFGVNIFGEGMARTGLPLRTLAKTLQKQPASSGELKRSTSIILMLVYALALAGIAAADYFIPILPISWLTWVSTGALALAVLCAVFSAVRIAFARSAPLAHATLPSAGSSSLDAPSLAYSLVWRPPLGRRVVLITLGLCLAINLVPGILLLLLALSVALPGYQPHMLSGDGGDFNSIGRFGLAIVHVLVGILGVGLVYGGAITATARIRADQSGSEWPGAHHGAA